MLSEKQINAIQQAIEVAESKIMYFQEKIDFAQKRIQDLSQNAEELRKVLDFNLKKGEEA